MTRNAYSWLWFHYQEVSSCNYVLQTCLTSPLLIHVHNEEIETTKCHFSAQLGPVSLVPSPSISFYILSCFDIYLTTYTSCPALHSFSDMLWLHKKKNASKTFKIAYSIQISFCNH